jgi:hypothetical protein
LARVRRRRDFDWVEGNDLRREQVRALIIAAFSAALAAAQQVDPKVVLKLD